MPWNALKVIVMPVRNIIIAGCLSILLVGVEPSGADDVLLVPIPEDAGLSPKIINGNKAKRADWPATLTFTSDAGECTATAIGERVIVTAAHCVGDRSKVQVLLSNEITDLTCEHHRDYNDHPPGKIFACHKMVAPEDIVSCTADIALCVADAKQTIPTTGRKFERIKVTPPGATPHQPITLLGYGCITAGGQMSVDLNVGTPEVVWTSRPNASKNPKDSYEEFIKTKGAATCQGDSGGAGYSTADPNSREIIAISSRGNLSTDSFLVNVLDQRIIDFFGEFSQRHGALICGRDSHAMNCVF